MTDELIERARSVLSRHRKCVWVAEREQGNEFWGIYGGSPWGRRVAGLITDEIDAEFIAASKELVPELVAEVERLETDRNGLNAQLGRVLELAQSWRYKGEFGWGPWQEGHGPDVEGTVLDNAATAIFKAVIGD